MNSKSEPVSLTAHVGAIQSGSASLDGEPRSGANSLRPSAQSRAGTLFSRVGPLFSLTVIAPLALAILYFGVLAGDVYISESKFVVRSPSERQKSGLGMLLGSAGFSSAGEESNAAQGYIESRDALRALDLEGLAREAWSNDRVSLVDRFDPLGLSGSFEALYLYYQNKVTVAVDAETGITTLTVRAFSARDAQQINAQLLKRAEILVNVLNERGRSDLVRYAEREVAEAQQEARSAALGLAAYRNRSGVIDPERQALVQLQMISKLQDELIGARMQLLQLRSAAAQNPQIPLLKVRISGLERAIKEQLGEVAGAKGSLSEAAAQYQRLQLQSQYADKALGIALASLQDARNEARRQQAYVERVAQPSQPDKAMEPRRFRGILATLILGVIAWGIGRMLLAGVREHQL